MVSPDESFQVVMRNSPAKRIKNRKSRAPSHDDQKHGFFHSSSGRFKFGDLWPEAKSEDDVDVRPNPPTIKQNKVGGFRLKACWE
jgi:hypothetical protein